MQPQMFQPDENGIYATVGVSAPRSWVAIMIHLMLGAILIYTALAAQPALHWQIFLLVFGADMLWQAERLRRTQKRSILLTETELRDSDGQILATLEDIEKIERGAFAFKPSHGFTVVTKTKQKWSRAPGLWWRFGRRLGIGGVTQAGQAKFMAEQLAQRIG
ncbi:MAG: hypothetical protein AAFU41_11850 [Pseudomonadota bacterium]